MKTPRSPNLLSPETLRGSCIKLTKFFSPQECQALSINQKMIKNSSQVLSLSQFCEAAQCSEMTEMAAATCSPHRPAVTSPHSNTPLKLKLMRHAAISSPLWFYVFPHVNSLDVGDIREAWQRLSGVVKGLWFPHRCYFSAKGTEPNTEPRVRRVNEGLANSRKSRFKHWRASLKRRAVLQGWTLGILSLNQGKNQHWQRMERDSHLKFTRERTKQAWLMKTFEWQQPEKT